MFIQERTPAGGIRASQGTFSSFLKSVGLYHSVEIIFEESFSQL